jgi:NADH-quinone oxidoreductase subunit G
LTDALGGKAGLYTHMAGGDLTARYGLTPGSNLGDLGEGDAILVIASDLEEEAPLWWLRVKGAAERGATLIVANPRETKLDRYASHIIRYAYGEETEAVGRIANPSHGERIDNPLYGFAEAENAVIFFGSEGLGLAGSAALAQACGDLLVKTGHVGKPNNGLVGVWPRANEQGAWDLGFRPVTDLSAKVLYIAAADPAGDDPGLRAQCSDAFLIVQELFLTETAKLADVVFPAQAQMEREGTFTSGERRVQRFYPVVAPKGGSLPDFEIAAKLGAKVGAELKGGFPSRIFPQIAAEIPAYAGITYRKLAEVREQWPIVGRDDLYYGGTSYKNEQGLGVQLPAFEADAAPWRIEAPKQRSGDALIAVPVTRLYDRGTTLTPSDVLAAHLPQPFIALNPADAEAQKAADGMRVNLGVNGVSVPVTVRVDENVPARFALVPRSLGIPLAEPAEITIQVAEVTAA